MKLFIQQSDCGRASFILARSPQMGKCYSFMLSAENRAAGLRRSGPDRAESRLAGRRLWKKSHSNSAATRDRAPGKINVEVRNLGIHNNAHLMALAPPPPPPSGIFSSSLAKNVLLLLAVSLSCIMQTGDL